MQRSIIFLNCQGSAQDDLSGSWALPKILPICIRSDVAFQHFYVLSVSGGQNSLSGGKKRLSGRLRLTTPDQCGQNTELLNLLNKL